MPAIPRRICIYSKDVSNITGKSERHARALLSRIRCSLGKAHGDLVTIHDFCQATKLRPEDVQQFLIN